MSRPIHVNIPYPLLVENLELVIERQINPEVFFAGTVLDSLITEELASVADALASSGLRTTIHAPFIDLNPGAVEPLVWEATRRRFNQALDAAEILKPRVIVFHPGYDRWRYGESQDRWLKNSVRLFGPVLQGCESLNCIAAVENIFEEEPSTLKALFEEIDSPNFRHCFDVGHWNLFNKVGLEEWFAELGSYIAITHVHDNRGTQDDHFPIGDGTIDFDLYFSLMKRYAPEAVYTIEAHDREKIERALVTLRSRLA